MTNSTMPKNAAFRKDELAVSTDTLPVLPSLMARVKAWHIDILIIVVGIPTLVFFVALGGMFALVGPWAILMSVVSIRKRSRYQGFISGLFLLLLSIVGLLLPNHLWSWCTFCGVVGLIGGVAYLASMLLETRK